MLALVSSNKQIETENLGRPAGHWPEWSVVATVFCRKNIGHSSQLCKWGPRWKSWGWNQESASCSFGSVALSSWPTTATQQFEAIPGRPDCQFSFTAHCLYCMYSQPPPNPCLPSTAFRPKSHLQSPIGLCLLCKTAQLIWVVAHLNGIGNINELRKLGKQRLWSIITAINVYIQNRYLCSSLNQSLRRSIKSKYMDHKGWNHK